MAIHTISAMFRSRAEAERAADMLRADSSLATTNVKVLPEGESDSGTTTGHPQETGGFMAALRNFFMPEEDRYGYAEGLRRGSYMVVADTDEAHAHKVMDILENAGAIDLDAEEARWRSEGWRGYEPSSSATAGSGATTGGMMGDYQAAATIPPVPGSTASDTAQGSATASTPAATATDRPATTGTTLSDDTVASHGTTLSDDTVAATGTTRPGTMGSGVGPSGPAAGSTDERIPLAEETLRVGKRVAQQGRVRVRTYVVETPVTETVHLRDERVEVERRSVDRPLSGDEADPFREREIEATETREEPVIAKDARVREELVLHKSTEERDETVRDTVRRTEVKEERGEDVTDTSDTSRDPTTTPRGS
ncbi:MAG TPA: YsnF/AvaK domain-containing protein [Rhodopila sp.]|nr:YsnF/AvaK domain-containing protein [Rhodopila sp.]